MPDYVSLKPHFVCPPLAFLNFLMQAAKIRESIYFMLSVLADNIMSYLHYSSNHKLFPPPFTRKFSKAGN